LGHPVQAAATKYCKKNFLIQQRSVKLKNCLTPMKKH